MTLFTIYWILDYIVLLLMLKQHLSNQKVSNLWMTNEMLALIYKRDYTHRIRLFDFALLTK